MAGPETKENAAKPRMWHRPYQTRPNVVNTRQTHDASRPVAPLRPAADAVTIDSTSLTVDAVVTRVLELYRKLDSAG